MASNTSCVVMFFGWLGTGSCGEECVLDGGESGKSASITSRVVMLSAVKGEGPSGVVFCSVVNVVETSFTLDGGELGKSASITSFVVMLCVVKGEGLSGVRVRG